MIVHNIEPFCLGDDPDGSGYEAQAGLTGLRQMLLENREEYWASSRTGCGTRTRADKVSQAFKISNGMNDKDPQ
jgi:hypothetical protein